MPIIPIVIEQHAEDVAFGWLLRDRAVSEPHFNLNDLADRDDRIEANLDGLRIAGNEGWEICKEATSLKEPGEIFTAGVLAFESRDRSRIDFMLTSVEADDELERALVSAAGWVDFDIIDKPVRRFLSAESPCVKRIGLATSAVHRRDPGPDLVQLIGDQDPTLRARAMKAAGELGRSDLWSVIDPHTSDEDEKCKFYAAWSLTLLGEKTGVRTLMDLCEKPGPYTQSACNLAVRKLKTDPAMNWLKELARKPDSIRTAIFGYGAHGNPTIIPWLIETMNVPELSRLAGEAFSMITGIDIEYEQLEIKQPEGSPSAPAGEASDENMDLDPDEDLPWPNSELVRKWWDENHSNYKDGKRYLCGNTISKSYCYYVLSHGFQRQRISAALELALMDPDQSLFEVRAPGRYQQRLLQKV